MENDRDWAYALKAEAYRDIVKRQFGPWDEAFQRGVFATRWNPKISSLVFIDGTPVGMVAITQHGNERWLDEIQLLKEWQSRGLGRAIIEDLIRGSPLRLQVLKENHRALNFYHRLGFTVVSESKTHHLMIHPARLWSEIKRYDPPTSVTINETGSRCGY